MAAKSNSVAGVALGCRMPARRDLKWTTRRVLFSTPLIQRPLRYASFSAREKSKKPSSLAIRMGLFNPPSHQNIKVSVYTVGEKIAMTPAKAGNTTIRQSPDILSPVVRPSSLYATAESSSLAADVYCVANAEKPIIKVSSN